ncbi:ABC transporter ATP-binding protein [Ramlibacter monticola]|uniref:ABC transporter ATP-binding protein n=1 Tax=Ramlibacter monticola TaxID=1926872 RepID=A0A937CVG5_9BURK|nr:ABC transporter ATP-binding protein [Ramlibacter monticola]MBL0394710.1 ABC transporter ATP-binding protein [Ramlibacter monticola]
MSSDVVIKVEGLSKSYSIYNRPTDRVKQLVLPTLHRLAGRVPCQYFRDFWALRKISFEIRKGETVGIMGANGSGKSTLLQLICETLDPTEGEIKTRGRIAALLELGSGFNPEFTGRENVYLNGQVLGLKKKEIDARFDEIAAFADIGEHLDQPVKTYSSGMFVRLAFAVQACIEPDILIVDEALAVGDIGFQYKCFRRMEALRARGTTILMVTHSSSSILEYADRCLVLQAGRLIGDTSDVLAAVMAYEKGMILTRERKEPASADAVDGAPEGGAVPTHAMLVARQRAEASAAVQEKRFGSARAIIAKVEISKANGTPLHDEPVVKTGETLNLRFTLVACECIEAVILGLSLSRSQGGDVWGDNNLAAGHPLTLEPGWTEVVYQVSLPLNSGEYLLHCGLATLSGGRREELDQRRPVCALQFWSSRELGGIVHAPISVLAPT